MNVAILFIGAAAVAIAALAIFGFRRRDRSGAAIPAAADKQKDKLVLREEELDIRKETVQTGEVVVRKEIVEEQRTIQVPVRREEVVIETKEADPNDPSHAKREVVRIPVKEERVDVKTVPVDLEEVKVFTRKAERLEQIHASLKREEAHIERVGDPVVEETGPSAETRP